jgi:hypothetical protein
VNVDERARRAAGGIHRAVDEREAGSTLDPLDRFEVWTDRRRRRERIAAGVVGVGLAILAIVVVVRVLSPNRTTPATVFPHGRLIVGEWHEHAELGHWYTINSDGTGRTNLGVVAACAHWFPDGSRILITDEAAGWPLRPAVVQPDGSGLVPLDGTHDPELSLGCGDVSPDGTRLALEGFNDSQVGRIDGIYTVRASDGGDPRRLTRGIDGVPRYSPDGTQIVFFRAKFGLHPDSSGALFVVGADGAGLRRITPWGAAFLGQNWSPDGRWIVFQRPFGRLCLVRPDGTGLHTVPVSLPPGSGAVGPSWSSDGAWIVFALQQGDASTIYAVRPDGTGLRRVTSATRTLQSSPDWRPTSG